MYKIELTINNLLLLMTKIKLSVINRILFMANY